MVARADFSDNQDYALVKLVLQHQSASGQIDWVRVTRQLPGSGSGSRVLRKTTLEIKQRLKSLKRTHGTNLQAFPPRFFRQATVRYVPKPLTALPSSMSPTTQPSSMMPPPTQPSPSIRPPSQPSAVTSPQADLWDASCVPISGVSKQLAIVPSNTTSRLVRRTKPSRDSFENASSETMSLLDVYTAITQIFAMITRADVRQPSGEVGLNSGEILPVGVTKMINASLIGPSDVFGDIGSGTGSVLAQVALQTTALRCVGLEIRYDLTARSREYMRQFTQAFSRLSRVSILTGDIKNVTDEIGEALRGCTIFYCNNKVFEPEDNLAVQEYIALSDARLVFVMDRFCGRCRGDRCVNKFCQMWESEPSIQVSVSWTASPVEMFVYHRRIQRSTSTLMSLIESMDDDID